MLREAGGEVKRQKGKKKKGKHGQKSKVSIENRKDKEYIVGSIT